MVADQLTSEWVKWRRRTRLAIVLALPLKNLQKALLVRIAEHLGEGDSAATSRTDERRWCWPSIKTLALACGKSERAIITARQQLESAGLIECAVRYERGTGRQTSNHYRIVWSEVGRLIDLVPMSAWKRPAQPNRAAKTSPPRCNHFTPPVKFQSENFTPGVKPLHPLNGIETQERNSPASDRPTLATAGGRRRGRDLLFGDWFSNEALKTAIRRRDADTLRRAFDELSGAAFAAPALSDAFVLFAAMAFDAYRAAKTSPVGLLATRLGRGEVMRENVTSDGWRWANEVCTTDGPSTPTVAAKAAKCWLCAARGHYEPTCDVCGTKPHGVPVRGVVDESRCNVMGPS